MNLLARPILSLFEEVTFLEMNWLGDLELLKTLQLNSVIKFTIRKQLRLALVARAINIRIKNKKKIPKQKYRLLAKYENIVDEYYQQRKPWTYERYIKMLEIKYLLEDTYSKPDKIPLYTHYRILKLYPIKTTIREKFNFITTYEYAWPICFYKTTKFNKIDYKENAIKKGEIEFYSKDLPPMVWKHIKKYYLYPAVCFVKKPNGNYRIVLDYNDTTIETLAKIPYKKYLNKSYINLEIFNLTKWKIKMLKEMELREELKEFRIWYKREKMIEALELQIALEKVKNFTGVDFYKYSPAQSVELLKIMYRVIKNKQKKKFIRPREYRNVKFDFNKDEVKFLKL